jgi:predicted nucleotidyltransferase
MDGVPEPHAPHGGRPIEPVLREVVRRILSEYGPVEKILLFGSAARGEQDEASDLDLIIIKRTSERFLRRLLAVPSLPVAADVFVYTPEEFAEMQAQENPFILTALQDAIVLYDSAGAAAP